MTPGKPTVRRLLGGGTLFAALGALVVASATPASASPLAWGNAQAWVADGDLAAGYSTAVSFGGDSEDHATAEDVFGPLAEYAEISGESRTFIDQDGAHAEARVESLSFRLTVGDLIGLGMIDAPPAVTPDDTPSDEELDPDSAEGREDAESSPESSETPETPEALDEPEGDVGNGDGEPEQGTPYEEPRDPEPTESPKAMETPEEEPVEGLGVSDARILPVSPSNEENPGNREPRTDDFDDDEVAIEFTMDDVVTSASAGYGGTAEATFEHGDITAFGESVDSLADGAHSSADVVEVFDEDGELLEEVPVGVHFVVSESTFDDDDEDWRGEGVRSWLTVWIQAGDVEGEDGFAVDLADSWALGSLYNEDSPASGRGSGGEEMVEETTSGGNLATTGSSLTALVTAAIVAVGGGTAATFLARKRTTAMDDQIED